MAPLGGEVSLPRFGQVIHIDPFESAHAGANTAVAPQAPGPTVRRSAGRQLTAILIADERRIAVIDDAAVSVGDLLRDGARVSSIQPDRVFVVDKSGKWTMLTLTNRGQ